MYPNHSTFDFNIQVWFRIWNVYTHLWNILYICIRIWGVCISGLAWKAVRNLCLSAHNHIPLENIEYESACAIRDAQHIISPIIYSTRALNGVRTEIAVALIKHVIMQIMSAFACSLCSCCCCWRPYARSLCARGCITKLVEKLYPGSDTDNA